MSKIKMSMVQSSGTWLNDCPQKQHYYVSIEIFNPEGRTSIVRVALSFEQVTRMLMYNGEVNCTLERYLGEDGKIHEEKVNPPETVHQRMKKRLDDAYKSLEKRIEDIRRDVYDMLNGNVKTGKNSLK